MYNAMNNDIQNLDQIPIQLRRLIDPNYIIFYDEKLQNEKQINDIISGKIEIKLNTKVIFENGVIGFIKNTNSKSQQITQNSKLKEIQQDLRKILTNEMKKNQDDKKQDQNFNSYLKTINKNIENQKDQTNDQQNDEDELEEDYEDIEDYYSQSRKSDQNLQRDCLYDFNQKDEDEMYQKMLQEMQDDIQKDLMYNIYDDIDVDDETYYIDQQRLQNNIKSQQKNNKQQNQSQEQEQENFPFKGYKNIQKQNQNQVNTKEIQAEQNSFQIDKNLIIDINFKKNYQQQDENTVKKNQNQEQQQQQQKNKLNKDDNNLSEDEWETDEEDNNDNVDIQKQIE